MWQGIDNKTGYKGLKGNSGVTYGDIRLLSEKEKQAAFDDGISEFVEPAKHQPTPEELLAKAKLAKHNQIKASYEWYLTQPVTDSNNIEWVGGFDSAIKLDAAKRLAETFGATEVTFYDYYNQGHVLTLADALAVIGLVAGDYQSALTTKNALYNQVDTAIDIAGVDSVAIPTGWVNPDELLV